MLVVGLGRFGGGVGVSRWLAEQGARVTVSDRADARTLAKSVEALDDLDIRFSLGEHNPRDLVGVDLIILNPAIDKTRSAFFRAIVEAGLPWTTEINLFCERCPAPVVGVTGSFGKSTTAAMLMDVLSCGTRTRVGPFTGAHFGGNIGRSLLGELASIRSTDVVVLELSSAQLEDLPRISWAPAVAVITNIFPHHLDRHGSFEHYIAAKLNIVAAATPESVAHSPTACVQQAVIVGDLDPQAERLLACRTSAVTHSVSRITSDDAQALELSLRGLHNQTNARTAYTTATRLGITEQTIRCALAAFRGLPHRLEHVATIGSVDYINDSKSTSPTATMVALNALDGCRVVAIVGGSRKTGVTYDACARALREHCRAVVCVGECGPDIASAIASAPTTLANCLVEQASNLAQAVSISRTIAKPGDVVLFSPGAPSFYAYPNYAVRGHHFASLVTGP